MKRAHNLGPEIGLLRFERITLFSMGLKRSVLLGVKKEEKMIFLSGVKCIE